MSATPYCGQCGSAFEPDCDFCTNCGNRKNQVQQLSEHAPTESWRTGSLAPTPVHQGYVVNAGYSPQADYAARPAARGRTESTTIQVHPSDEQSQINLMQRFHWSLLSTQEIKTIDNHLERRGDKIYQVTNSENYVKLAFSRDVGLPYLNEVKRLEAEYFSLPMPSSPSAVSCLMLIGIGVAFLFFAAITQSLLVGILFSGGLYAAFFFLMYTPKKKVADDTIGFTMKRRGEILKELERYS